MKKILTAFVSVSLLTLTPAAPVIAMQPATLPVAVCIAKSPSATGWATGYNMYETCNRALYECAKRTPATEVCYVTNRWWEA